MTCKTPPGRRPVIVKSCTDAAAVLTKARLDRGWSGEELDARAGFPDRYSIKMENPRARWGRRGLHISPMWELWAEALGLCLVIMAKDQAEAMGAVEAGNRPAFGGTAKSSATPYKPAASDACRAGAS